MSTRLEQQDLARDNARLDLLQLLQLLQPGDVIRVINRHTSSSGMTRFLDLYVIKDNDTRRLTWSAAKAMGWTYSDRWDAMKVEGCGMDMGFHAVYTLAHYLFAREQFADVVVKGDDHDRRGYWLECRWL